MNRYIITVKHGMGKTDIIVVRAKTTFMANKIAELKSSKYKNFYIHAIRELFNPMCDPLTDYFFKPIEVPEAAMQKYLYWDNSNTGIEFNF